MRAHLLSRLPNDTRHAPHALARKAPGKRPGHPPMILALGPDDAPPKQALDERSEHGRLAVFASVDVARDDVR